ncbi:MAG: hypothetical protein JSS83_01100 [Cyanobacteria bacterium SZAS LIN-3]|nr:hypothetical protein [Cyanobacteria bacterium SZAS LIN-3]
MKSYFIAFILVVVASAALTNYKAPAIVPTGIAGVKPASLGLIRDESGVGEIRINDAARVWRYSTEVTTKHPSRGSDFPFFGNN